MTTESFTPDLSETTPATGRAVVVPDKPALEGLEATWAARWKADDTYAFDRSKTREQIFSIDTPPPTVSGLAARRPRLLLHAHRPDRPLPADARQGGLLPDGLGRQRPADRAPGAELLRRALRPVAALRRRLHAAGEAGPEASRCRSAGRTSSSCASSSSSEDEQVFESLWRTPGPLRRLEADLHDDRREVPDRRRSGRSCATSPAARPTSRSRRRCGTSPSRPRSRRPSSRRGSTPAPTTGSRSTGPTASRCTSRPPGPS